MGYREMAFVVNIGSAAASHSQWQLLTNEKRMSPLFM
jgi:hypothetical protein